MRRRIVTCLALLLALCLTGDAIALFSLNRSIRRISELAESHRIQTMRSTLDSNGIRLERDLLTSLIRPEAGSEQLRDSVWRFKDSLQQCNTCHHTEEVQDRLRNIQVTFDAWLDESAAIETGAGSRTLDTHQLELLELANRVPAMTTAMVDRAHVRLLERSTEAKEIVHQAWVTLCSTLLAALVFGGVVALYLQRSLTRPLYALLDWVSNPRRGAAVEGPPLAADAEFQQLGRAFHKAYQDLENAQRGIVQAEKMAAIGQVAAGVAHEVNNPLASISAIVHIMRRRAASDDDVEQFDLITRHVQRISGIVRGILTFSRPIANDMLSIVEVRPLLDHAIELLSYDRRANDIEIVCDCEPGLPAVSANPDKLMLAFTNLILNAIDAISEKPSGKGTLRVEGRREGKTVVLRFIDDGAGMAAENLENVFQPFFTTKQPGEGTGLGLWICYETVRTHGGHIQIESELGKGTTVTVEFPCPRPAPAP